MTQKNFEHRLLDSLMDEWNPAESPRRRRGHYARMAVMPVVVTGVAAALLVGTQLGSSAGRTSAEVAAPTNPTTELPSDPKLIASAVNGKMHSAKDVIVHAKQTTWQRSDRTGTYSKSEMWSDGGERHFRDIEFAENSDTPVFDGSSDSQRSMQIDYKAKTFQSCARRAEPSGAMNGGAGTASNSGLSLIGDITSDTLAGHESIDGVDTLHLLDHEEGMNREVWVDAQSLLPVRMTAHGDWGSYVIEYDWLTRSDENIKLFTLTSPAGFKDVSTTSCRPAAGADGSKNPVNTK
jgi:hypothetical protein